MHNLCGHTQLPGIQTSSCIGDQLCVIIDGGRMQINSGYLRQNACQQQLQSVVLLRSLGLVKSCYPIAYNVFNRCKIACNHRAGLQRVKAQALQADQIDHHQRFAALFTKDGLSPDDILTALETVDLQDLMGAAAAVRDCCHTFITFSPKVFIPLTQLCNDSCGYCTFARGPLAGRRAYMTLDEVLEVARLGALQGCTEALFTLVGSCFGYRPALANDIFLNRQA